MKFLVASPRKENNKCLRIMFIEAVVNPNSPMKRSLLEKQLPIWKRTKTGA